MRYSVKNFLIAKSDWYPYEQPNWKKWFFVVFVVAILMIVVPNLLKIILFTSLIGGFLLEYFVWRIRKP